GGGGIEGCGAGGALPRPRHFDDVGDTVVDGGAVAHDDLVGADGSVDDVVCGDLDCAGGILQEDVAGQQRVALLEDDIRLGEDDEVTAPRYADGARRYGRENDSQKTQKPKHRASHDASSPSCESGESWRLRP